jgi:hypothetical protein
MKKNAGCILCADAKVLERVFAFAESVDLLRLSRTCRSIHDVYKDYAPRAFDINRRLARFFYDPIKFRSMQARGSTLISGSFALQFFDRSFYLDSDLDLYLHHGEAKAMGKFLVSEGYVFIPRRLDEPEFEEQEPVGNCRVGEPWEEAHGPDERVEQVSPARDYMRGVRRVYTFEKGDGDTGVKKVQLMVTWQMPMDVILNYHSSWSNHSFPFLRHSIILSTTHSMCHERDRLRLRVFRLPMGHVQRSGQSPIDCKA